MFDFLFPKLKYNFCRYSLLQFLTPNPESQIESSNIFSQPESRISNRILFFNFTESEFRIDSYFSILPNPNPESNLIFSFDRIRIRIRILIFKITESESRIESSHFWILPNIRFGGRILRFVDLCKYGKESKILPNPALLMVVST